MPGLYGVIGYPVKHSLSPAMFSAAFWEYNMEDEYEHFEVHPDDLGAFMREVKSRPVMGLSVTIPHKETIIKHLDSLDVHSKNIGAVNTVVNVDGKLKGYNTDWIGAQRAIENNTGLEDKHVLILGAGGAAKAVAYGCKQAGARVTILNRNVEKAKQLAENLDAEAGSIGDILQYRPHILVHTTSVGMAPNIDQTLVPTEFYKRGMFVMDIVYTPMETRLVREAKRAECRIIPGYKMLLYQGEKQFEIWFGKKPRTAKMEEALLSTLKVGC
jgi:shikimate dehydrogenase